ncbi:MAG: chondroitinase family polysaccharide lyase, partial [Bacteroidales bacterium]
MNYRKKPNKKTSLLAALFLSASMSLSAHNFESSVPATLSVESGFLSLSTNHFKVGAKSLKWDWNKGNSVLTFTDAIIKNHVSSFDNRSGITFWVYNETPQTKPLKFDFLDEQGRIQYTFDFNLDFTGWRAGWIAYKDMWTPSGESPVKKYVSVLKINSPAGISSGTLYLDRLNFVKLVDHQATPDAQIPDNNRHLDREIWHWGMLHKWNTQSYDLPLSVPTAAEQKEMDGITVAIKSMLKGRTLSASDRTTLSDLVTKVRLTPDGGGAPLMLNNSVKSGDISFTQLNQLLDLSSRGWYIDNNEPDKQTFISAVKYALDQGFAYESGMGTNHHYGYSTREIYGAVWWMQDVLTAAGLWDDAYRMVTYWSGLAECRQPFNPLRDEITDSWNTLILPKLACAAMNADAQQRLRDLRSLSRWVSGSLSITPGTIGGIKVDGTIFHHGGHYPAYGIPGLAYVGKYLSCVNGTSFTITDEARDVMKLALTASRNYSNLRSWGLAQCGRNPFNGEISNAGGTAFGYAAQAGTSLDRELAADFMRIKEGQRLYTDDNNMYRAFRAAGISEAVSPQGFYIFNYNNLGTYRYKDQMVTLKGMSNTLWGSEIYSQNNRFGRYQSYGSVLI